MSTEKASPQKAEKTVNVTVNNDNTLGLLVVTALLVGYVCYNIRRRRKAELPATGS